MGSFRKLLFILTVIIILPAGLFAQAGSSDPGAAADVTVDAAPEGFNVSIDLRLAGTAVSIIPGLSAIIGVPISLGSDSLALVPQVGFLYFFDVWTDIHSSYYIPVGIGVIYNPLNIGLEVLYYPPVGDDAGIHLISATAAAEMMFLEAEAFSMHFGMGLGPVFILDPAAPRMIFRVNSALILRYRI